MGDLKEFPASGRVGTRGRGWTVAVRLGESSRFGQARPQISLGGIPMKLILRVSSSNEYCDGGCEYAAVELTRELASLALRRIEALKEGKKTDELVYETYYWDFN